MVDLAVGVAADEERDVGRVPVARHDPAVVACPRLVAVDQLMVGDVAHVDKVLGGTVILTHAAAA